MVKVKEIVSKLDGPSVDSILIFCEYTPGVINIRLVLVLAS